MNYSGVGEPLLVNCTTPQQRSARYWPNVLPRLLVAEASFALAEPDIAFVCSATVTSVAGTSPVAAAEGATASASEPVAVEPQPFRLAAGGYDALQLERDALDFPGLLDWLGPPGSGVMANPPEGEAQPEIPSWRTPT
eukprot:tig00000523_g1836.t1